MRFVSLLPVVLAAAASAAAASSLDDARLPAGRLWDDGQAEFTTYDVVGRREGAERRYRGTIVVVKEEMDVAARVKARSRDDFAIISPSAFPAHAGDKGSNGRFATQEDLLV